MRENGNGTSNRAVCEYRAKCPCCGELIQIAAPGSTSKLLLTVAELSEATGISERELYRMRSRGELPPPRKVGRASRWLVEEVESAIRALPVEGKSR